MAHVSRHALGTVTAARGKNAVPTHAVTHVNEQVRNFTDTGWVRLIRSLSSATFSFELSGFSN